jgi:hypothetical protein
MNGAPMLELQKSSSSGSLVKRRKKRRELERLLNGRLVPHHRSSSRSAYELTRDDSFSESDSNPGVYSQRSYYQNSGHCRMHMNVLTYISLLLSICAFVCSGVLLWLFFLSRGDLHRVSQEILTDMNSRQSLFQEVQSSTSSFRKLQTHLEEIQKNLTDLCATIAMLQTEITAHKKKIEILKVTDQTSKQLQALPMEMKGLQETTASLGSSLHDMKAELTEKALPRLTTLEGILHDMNVSLSAVQPLKKLFPDELLHQIANISLSNSVSVLRGNATTVSTTKQSHSIISSSPVIFFTLRDFTSLMDHVYKNGTG